MFITVSTGYKRAAKVHNNTVWNYDSYETDSKVQVYIEQTESQTNETVVSRTLLDSDKSWKALTRTKLQDSTTEGLIEAKIYSEYVVKVLGLIALLPYSLIAGSLCARTLARLKLKLFQLNKSENFIKLSLLGSEKEKPAHQVLCNRKEIWGTLKEAPETGIVLDLGERARRFKTYRDTSLLS